MITKIFAPLFLAGAAAAAIALSPTAAAGPSADCEDKGSASVCTRTGHAAIYAEPARRGNPVGPGALNPFGGMPQLFAIG